MTKFRHDDALERAMPERQPAKYADTDFNTCEVRVVRVAVEAVHYRTTLVDAGMGGLLDDRYFGLGLTPEDLECAHLVAESPDRAGHATCARCTGHLWSAFWVADGWQGDDTLAWAQANAEQYAARLPKLRLVR